MKEIINKIISKMKEINKEMIINEINIKNLLNDTDIVQSEIENNYTILKINENYLKTKKEIYFDILKEIVRNEKI